MTRRRSRMLARSRGSSRSPDREVALTVPYVRLARVFDPDNTCACVCVCVCV